jgi:hypothetical protein
MYSVYIYIYNVYIMCILIIWQGHIHQNFGNVHQHHGETTNTDLSKTSKIHPEFTGDAAFSDNKTIWVNEDIAKITLNLSKTQSK